MTDDIQSADLRAAATLLGGSRHLAIVTGAGISAESGIATFRDALTGLWQRFDAAELATREAFERDPGLVWGWYEWRRMQVLRSRPNPGHLALAELARRLPRCTLITQNVDDLHERAGSADVLHVHGSLHTPRCLVCGWAHAHPAGVPDKPEGGRRLAPPACNHCGGPVRPGVVWFGESLPLDIWAAAETGARTCDVLLSVGTSGLVYPAAGLVELASDRGKPVIVINPGELPRTHVATLHLRGAAGRMLPEVLALMGA